MDTSTKFSRNRKNQSIHWGFLKQKEVTQAIPRTVFFFQRADKKGESRKQTQIKVRTRTISTRYIAIVSLLILGTIFNFPKVSEAVTEGETAYGDRHAQELMLAIEEREVNWDYFGLVWRTNQAAAARISWGKTMEFEQGELEESVDSIIHETRVYNLDPDTLYYFSISYIEGGREMNYVGTIRTLKDPSVEYEAIGSVDGVTTKLDLDGAEGELRFEDIGLIGKAGRLGISNNEINGLGSGKVRVEIPEGKIASYATVEIEVDTKDSNTIYVLPSEAVKQSSPLIDLPAGADLSFRFFDSNGNPIKEVSGKVATEYIQANIISQLAFLPAGFFAFVFGRTERVEEPEMVVIRRKFDKEHGDDA